MTQARTSMGTLDQSGRGRLRIGCTAAASQFILPTVLREFKESFPLYDLKIIPGETPDTLERLENNEIDLSVRLPTAPRKTERVQDSPVSSRGIALQKIEYLPLGGAHRRTVERRRHHARHLRMRCQ